MSIKRLAEKRCVTRLHSEGLRFRDQMAATREVANSVSSRHLSRLHGMPQDSQTREPVPV